MERWKRNLWVLWIAAFIGSSSLTMVIPFLPLFLVELGVDNHIEMWSGLIYSSAFLASALTSPILGGLADRFGRKPMIIRAGLVLFIVFTLTAFVTNEYQLLGLRIFHGLLAGYIPAVIALVGTSTPEEKSGFAMSIIATAMASGRIMGPMLGGSIANAAGYRATFGLAGGLIILSTLLVFFLVTEERSSLSKKKVSVLESFRIAGTNRPFVIVLVLTLLTGISMQAMEPIISLYIVELDSSVGNSPFLAGLIFSLLGISGILFAPLWGRLADRYGLNRILMIGMIGGGIGCIAQIIFHNLWGFSIMRFIYGAFLCGIMPAINGLVVKYTTPDFRGRAFSLNNTFSQLSGMIGPLIGGALAGFWSMKSIFWMTGLMLFACLIFTNMLREKPVAVKESKPAVQLDH
jgi:MFS family permease